MASYELVIYVQLVILVILAMIYFRSGERPYNSFYYGIAAPTPNIIRYSRSFPYE